MTFVLIVMALAVVGVLAAVRLVYTTQDFNDFNDLRHAEAQGNGGGTGAGWEDTKPASVPEAFSDAPRTAALRLVRSPRQDVTQPTLDDAMAEWDQEWLWPPYPDNAA